MPNSLIIFNGVIVKNLSEIFKNYSMFKVEKYNIKEINRWFTNHIDANFLESKSEIILPKAPFEIEISDNIYATEIAPIYKNNQENGGIIFCKIIYANEGMKLRACRVEEIENVYETTSEDPTRSRANAYRPNRYQYLTFMEDNFSKTAEDILFPIHFHTHPTKDAKEEREYYNAFSQLHTSEADRNVAQARFMQFNNIKLRYANAIITGHGDIHNILIYIPDVTPLEFMQTKIDRIYNTYEKGGRDFAETVKSEGWKKVIPHLSKLGALFTHLAFRDNIDEFVHFFKSNEYFTTFEEKTTTVIRIPEIDTNGKIIPIPEKPKPKFIFKR